MCADGLYEIALSHSQRSLGPPGRALLICRAGRLFGSDQRGRLYRGRLRMYANRAVRKDFINAVYETPPRVKPVPGTTTEMLNVVSISGEIDALALNQNTTVLVGRRAIDIEITYLGPLSP